MARPGDRAGRVAVGADGDVEQSVVEPSELPAYAFVVPPDEEGEADKRRGDHDGHPASLGEFFDDAHDQDRQAHGQAGPVDGQIALPIGVRGVAARPDPVTGHAHFRQRECQEHVDGVHEDEQVALTPRVQQHGDRSETHQEDAVVGHEAVRELGKAPRRPRVHGHVGEDARAIDEARLCCDEEQSSFGHERHDDQDPPDGRSGERPRTEERFGEDGVQSLAGN